MKNITYRIYSFSAIICLMYYSSCKKQDAFLDQKPSKKLSTITTINDVQNLLNNQSVFNMWAGPTWGQGMSDDQYITSDDYANYFSYSLSRSFYRFEKDIFTINDVDVSWNGCYQIVYYSNVILDALPKISATSSQLNYAKGAALYCRASAFYDLLQTYALPYDSVTAKTDLGIPLRQTSDLNVKSVRASEQECYTQIINDLNTAGNLLPVKNQYVTLPSTVAVNALLARIYLEMGKYDQAYKYANLTLTVKGDLTDFNKLSLTDYYLTTPDTPYPLNEDIYHECQEPFEVSGFYPAMVDSVLYNSYDDNDIRKTAFFINYAGGIRFQGSYEFKNFGLEFCGLATDEMYLTRAESSVRLGNIASGMADLNKLLINRYKTGTFVQHTANSAEDALNQILIERRKELVDRGVRWLDLRRLNKDPKYAVTLKHVINGVTYTLPPNDPRYAMQIPPIEVQLSGIQQNPR